jgi:DNA-binding SARP family transcriptional activator
MQPGVPRNAPSVCVYTLGTFRVVVHGRIVEDGAWRRRTARQLFKLLLSRRDQHVSRDEIVELFWPESDVDAAASNLRSTMHALRRMLQSSTSPMAVVCSDRDGVWLGPDIWTDATSFEDTVAAAWRSADPLPDLQEASTLYGGDYLPDDLYEDWATERRDALRQTWTELQLGLAQTLESRSDVDAAAQPLERLLRADACHEPAAQALMRLLSRHGRRAEALRVYQRLTQSLRDDLDVAPSAESVELQRQISSGESVSMPPAASTCFHCAYPFPSPHELVGREAELAALWQVVASGRTAGRTAFISAPAGTGKSALLGQIVQRAEAQGILCLAGGCYTERGAVPFGPFHDALVDYLLVQPPEGLHARLGSRADALAELLPELRYHLHTSTRSDAIALDRMQAFGVIHACLRSLAECGPVVVCLEDLQAADQPTLQLLHYLARQTRRLPIVFLATRRDDEPADQLLGQTIAAMLRERLAQQFVLTSLGREQSDRLAGILLEGPPSQELGEALFVATGGNPLFVEELALALCEAGQLERRSGAWHVAGELQDAPHVVREAIVQRVQRLEPGCRDVLAMASVLGQSFERDVLLSAVAPLEEATLLGHVDQAVSAHILQATPGGYAFHHTLMREAVYWGITAPRRKLLHARAGEVLERLRSESANVEPSQLAYHFSLAGDSRDVRAKTLRYSLAAGRRALALASYAEAVVQFERATQLVEADPGLASPTLRLDAARGRGVIAAHLTRPGVVACRTAISGGATP